MKDPNNPPAVLQTTINHLYGVAVTVNNIAISGTTMAQMLAGTDGSGMTFEQRISGTSGSVNYCNHCINDFQLNNDLNTYRLNVAEFVRICRKYNKVPVLVTANINPATNIDSQAAIIGETKCKRLEKYVSVMLEVATDLSVDLVDQYHYYQRTARMIAPKDLVPDGAHPSSDA
ncbi:SGNH/GDSL hydrolase family protein [Enterobacter sp.]|uniref:SGNH/GDSL hydrolase family protein n=1 Tax=Enterobacter sp. TaxID=42895 RepID=UPI0031E48B4C